MDQDANCSGRAKTTLKTDLGTLRNSARYEFQLATLTSNATLKIGLLSDGFTQEAVSSFLFRNRFAAEKIDFQLNAGNHRSVRTKRYHIETSI